MSNTTTIAKHQTISEPKSDHRWRWETPRSLSESSRISTLSAQEQMARLMRISDVRSEIAKGTYDSDRRLELALDRMIDSLSG